MTMDEIKALIAAMGTSDLAEMEVAKDGWSLRLVRRTPGAAVPPGEAASAPRPAASRPSPRPAAAPDAEVRAPLGGVVYLAASPGGPPFVSEGQTVEAGALLCTVEAMKTFNEVRAARAGTVGAVLVASGDEVEAGQPLLRVG